MFWNSFLAFFFNLVQLCAVKWKAAILVGASRPWSLSVVHSRVFLWRRSCFFTKKMEDSQNFSNFYQNLWKESTKDLIKQWIKPLSWLSINYLTEKNCYERVSWLNFCFIAPKTRAFPEKKKIPRIFSNFYQNLWKESTKDLTKQWIKPFSWLSANCLTEKNWYCRVSWPNFRCVVFFRENTRFWRYSQNF